MDRRSFAIGGLAVATGLAGCTLWDAESYDIQYTATNESSTTYELRLSVLSSDDTRVEVRWEDREPMTRDAGDLLTLLESDRGRVTAVEPIGEPYLERTHQLEPGDAIDEEAEAIPDGSAVVAVATAGESSAVDAYGSWLCTSDTVLRTLEIRFEGDGSRWFGSTCA